MAGAGRQTETDTSADAASRDSDQEGAAALPPDDDSVDSIAEIIASQALVAAPDGNRLVDNTDWLLLDAWRLGIPRTDTIATRVATAMGRSAGLESSAVPTQDDFALRLARTSLLARVLGLPAHQAREAVQRLAFDIPLADHHLVDVYIDYFSGRGRWFFERWLERADRYIPIMQPILREAGLPEDLVYVAMIESGFSSKAVSTAAACGFWQFIGSTGRMFKLRTDVWVDERRDFVRATEAAAAYYTALYKEFGDWHLAWAAYNAGEGRIRRALAKYGETDFWSLIEHKNGLAKETQHYVPKIIAAAIVAKDREKYGFPRPAPNVAPWRYEEIEVDDATELGALATKLGLDLEELRELNPALLYGMTPPGRHSMLRVPAGRGAEVLAWVASVPRAERLSYSHHKVRAGDSLSKIALTYGSTLAAVREFNHIANVKRLRPGQMLIIPVAHTRRAAAPATAVAHPASQKARAAATTAQAKAKAMARHRVSAGETLWSIAQHYGVSVQRIRAWNGRRSDHLTVGELLQVAAPQS